MKLYFTRTLPAIVLLVTLFAGCKKEDNQTNTQVSNLRIKTITRTEPGQPTHTDYFSYDSDNRFIQLVRVGLNDSLMAIVTYQYNADSVIWSDGGPDTSTRYVTLVYKVNADGRIADNTFDTDGHRLVITSNNTVYEWQDGNNVRTTYPGNYVVNYTYYTDKANTVDYVNKGILVFGVGSVNAVATETNNSGTTYTYIMDSEGRIAQKSWSTGRVEEYTYM